MFPLLDFATLSPPCLTVRIRSQAVLNRFDPGVALGGCLDGGTPGESALAFGKAGLRSMRSVGLGPLAYRLRTELAGEAWHWNPIGRFSEGTQGYWTSSSDPSRPILKSYGYRLPRRGDTFDQAVDDGYSRLTDGDPSTFWKSSPYLDDTSPQWVLVRLPRLQAVDAIRLRWAEPYGRRFRAEYWQGDDSGDVDGGQEGSWRRFPAGDMAGHAGEQVCRVGRVEEVRWVRLRLLASSHTPLRSRDPRDARGFAIREVGVGSLRRGRFVDALVHRPDHGQSAVWVSSTDPWHRACDRDPKLEQPGLDQVFRSGLANGRPVLMPAGVLYDTPENMAALFRWLRRKRVPVRGFELGEEPDGQVCAPEDYAALYLRTANALRAVDPAVRLGGPGFQTIESDYARWALEPLSPPGERGGGEGCTWAARFLADLRRRHGLDRLDFFSFEWYPFDDLGGDPAAQLARAPGLLGRALDRLALPPGLPMVMTEYGYSAYAAPAAVDLPGALLNLDLVAGFLERGGRAAYLYGLPPAPPSEDRKGLWGALATSLPDGTPLATYWAARLMVEDWCGVASGSRALLATGVSDPLVSVHALRRPDGRLSVLMLNKAPRRSRTVCLDLDGRSVPWGNLARFGPDQYVWHAAGAKGRPSRSLPPARSIFVGTIVLPPYSATVATFGVSSRRRKNSLSPVGALGPTCGKAVDFSQPLFSKDRAGRIDEIGRTILSLIALEEPEVNQFGRENEKLTGSWRGHECIPRLQKADLLSLLNP